MGIIEVQKFFRITTGWIDKEVAADEAKLKVLKLDQSMLVY